MSKTERPKPQPGQVALFCAHNIKSTWHWFGIVDGPVTVIDKRPSEECDASWIVLCQECFDQHATSPLKAARRHLEIDAELLQKLGELHGPN